MTKKQTAAPAAPTETAGQIVSIKLSDMTLDELVQINQGLGHDIERLRLQRQHVNKHIAARLARGERTGQPREGEEGAKPGDATAPGANIDVTAAKA